MTLDEQAAAFDAARQAMLTAWLALVIQLGDRAELRDEVRATRWAMAQILKLGRPPVEAAAATLQAAE